MHALAAVHQTCLICRAEGGKVLILHKQGIILFKVVPDGGGQCRAVDLFPRGKEKRSRVLSDFRGKFGLVDVESCPDGDRADLAVLHPHFRQDSAEFAISSAVDRRDDIVGPLDAEPASGRVPADAFRGLIDRQGHHDSQHGGDFGAQVGFEENTHINVPLLRGDPGPAPPALAGSLSCRDDKRPVRTSLRRQSKYIVIGGSGLLLKDQRSPRPGCGEFPDDLLPVENICFFHRKEAVAFIGHRLDGISLFFQFLNIFPDSCAGDTEHFTQLLPRYESFRFCQPPQNFLFSVHPAILFPLFRAHRLSPLSPNRFLLS